MPHPHCELCHAPLDEPRMNSWAKRCVECALFPGVVRCATCTFSVVAKHNTEPECEACRRRRIQLELRRDKDNCPLFHDHAMGVREVRPDQEGDGWINRLEPVITTRDNRPKARRRYQTEQI